MNMKIAKATPFEGKPVFHLPSVFGACPGKELLLRVPVIGKRPISVTADNLPEGLQLQNNILSGTVNDECEFTLTFHAQNECGNASCEVLFKIHPDTQLLTPLLGFTSWNAFGSAVSQEKVEATAKCLVESSLADYGYSYMNIDSGWQFQYGGKYDAIMPNEKFPDMKAFCDHMHALGLKCGIYSTPMLTAWGCPKEFESIPGCTTGEPEILQTSMNGGIGTVHKEANNVKQWEEWGFDYLKYDWIPTDPTNADKMKQELLKSSRAFGFCVTVEANPCYGRYWAKNCSSFRNNIDSRDDWQILKSYLDTVGPWENIVCPGHYYDLDMLEIGCCDLFHEGDSYLTPNEEIFAFSLRAFFLSPIQLSCRLEKLNNFQKNVLCNSEVLAINQDALADYPKPDAQNPHSDVKIYRRKLENGDLGIALFNTSDVAVPQTLNLGEYQTVRNLWTWTEEPASANFSCVVEPHCAQLLRIQ